MDIQYRHEVKHYLNLADLYSIRGAAAGSDGTRSAHAGRKVHDPESLLR